MVGRETLQKTLDAIAAREFQRAGETALSGVATPLRVAGEALAGLVEAFAQKHAGAASSASNAAVDALGSEWRDRVVVAIDDVVPKLLDAMQVLYANVLFERLLRPREEPMFKLEVPATEEIAKRAADEVRARGRADASLHHAGTAFQDATRVLDEIVRVADTWSACANDAEKLKEFYAQADEVAKDLMDRATSLRVAAAIFRGDAAS